MRPKKKKKKTQKSILRMHGKLTLPFLMPFAMFSNVTIVKCKYKFSISFFVFHFILHQSQLAMHLFNFSYNIAKV